MKYLSVCSGIEAATVAWHPLGWKAAAYSEIEKFPSEVLAHHYPDVPNVGDMTKFKEWTNVSDVNVLVGGTPCQSFSVAGLRKGLDDPRGNLMLTYLAIAAKYRPKWLVWENVPGVLSSNGGLDFASLLRGMGELGYGFAYRVLDAQYFGVAQRRRRVFVVGYAGNWRPAAAVLFERHSMCGYPAPSREKGQDVTGTIEASLGRSRGAGTPTSAVTTHRMVAFGEYSDDGTASAMKARDYKDATDLVAQPIPFDTTQITSKANGSNPQSGDPCHPLAAGAHAPAIALPICLGGQHPNAGIGIDQSPTLTNAMGAGGGHVPITNAMQPIAFEPGKIKRLGRGNAEAGLTPTLRANAGDNQLAVAFPWQSALDPIGKPTDLSGTLVKNQTMACMTAMQVRRLTPVECERLQGFPDNYTDIKAKGKPTPDGPRYKALGNSMAVPVMAWIGKRIQEVEELSERHA